MATKKETTAESTMPTQEEMQKLLEENARLKAERDARRRQGLTQSYWRRKEKKKARPKKGKQS